MVEFQAEDGEPLTGRYYPASQNTAPVIVLMHWAQGDQEDWDQIARWLQGRGLLVREPDYNHSWKSSQWFPERTLDLPLGVFTFNFRNCEGGCRAYQPAAWLLDARAAMQTAGTLQGADPDRVLSAGASIGADGAVAGCAWLNTTDLATCRGSFALSPTSSLTVDFRSAAQFLEASDPRAPVYCLYGLRDDGSAETCGNPAGWLAVDYGYTDQHGLELVQPERGPNPLELLETFLEEGLGVDE